MGQLVSGIAEVGSALGLYSQERARHLKAHGSAVLLLIQVKVGWLVARLAVYQFGVFSQMSASLIWTVMLLFKIYCLTRIIF